MYQYNEEALERLRLAFSHVQSLLPREPFGRDSPNLVVLLRDARLRMQQAGRSIPPEGLLHAALQPVGDRLDTTRSAIVALFPNRTMLTMRHPEGSDLAKMEQVPFRDALLHFPQLPTPCHPALPAPPSPMHHQRPTLADGVLALSLGRTASLRRAVPSGRALSRQRSR